MGAVVSEAVVSKPNPGMESSRVAAKEEDATVFDEDLVVPVTLRVEVAEVEAGCSMPAIYGW
jgi:hypothetical protein